MRADIKMLLLVEFKVVTKIKQATNTIPTVPLICPATSTAAILFGVESWLYADIGRDLWRPRGRPLLACAYRCVEAPVAAKA